MHQAIRKAFTLIELLVVIAIIGILSGLIVVSMSGVTQKANIAKGQAFSNSLKNSLMLNLISEWKLDENTGTATYDSWSGGNNGTLAGGATLPIWKTNSDCVYGSCLDFDGSDDHVTFGSNSNLFVKLGDVTVSFWAKFDNAIAPQYETLIFCGASGSGVGSDGYWIRRELNSNRLYACFSDGETTTRLEGYLSPIGSLVADTWYNIVVLFDRDDVARAYINGSKQSLTLNLSSQQENVLNSSVYKIGAYNLTGHRLDGKMDEIRVYDSLMSVSQIKEQYYAGLNNLLINGSITKGEYLSRINNYAVE